MANDLESNRFKYCGNRFISMIIKNVLFLEREIIMQTKYEFNLEISDEKETCIKPGINTIRNNKLKLKRG
jgi:hypothetical protein